MITRNTIDKVYETARVEEVIGDFMVLKKSGTNFKGLSPFSQERTPSFMVSPVKQIWKDFSSGKGGNVVAFLMEHEHFTYPEAIRFLAKRYNIEIEETEQSDKEKEKANTRESLYLVNQFAQNSYADDLWESSEGMAIGLSYFRERGITDESIRFFCLGYAAEQIDHFYKKSLKAGYSENFLLETGLKVAQPIIELFFKALKETGYAGPMVIEMEDRAYEGSLEAIETGMDKARDYVRTVIE